MSLDTDLPRAFITCAARAMTAVAPLVAEAEQLLLDAGWRTRVPRRALPRQGEALDDRRRLRATSYDEVERSAVLVHVPAPAQLAGMRLHRELQHAVDSFVPVLLLVAAADRGRLEVGLPHPVRVQELAALTAGILVERLEDLPRLANDMARERRHSTG